MTQFTNVFDTHKKNLELYVPVVARVHGPTHPEFYKVQKEYDAMIEKLNANNHDLETEFTNLKEITNNYTVPSDTCETYEAVYKMLEAMDLAFFE